MSADGKLTLELEKRLDSDGRPYYLTKLKGPFTIDCSNGVCFLVFVSDEGAEELQIASLTQKKDKYNDNR